MKPAKTVLITGAARRIGAAIAGRLHAEGWNLVLHAHRSQADAEALGQALNQRRADSAVVELADLRDAAAIERLAAAAAGHWGSLDALVNNASSYYATPLPGLTAAAIADLVGTNLQAPLLLTQACLPFFAEGAAVVNLIDVGARRPRAGYSAYCAAKAGLWAATEALALELAPRLRINGVAPGYALWAEADGWDAAQQAAALAAVPLRRLGGAEPVAETVAFLLSPAAAFIHGAVVPVDGGLHLG